MFRNSDPLTACSNGASGTEDLVCWPHHIIKPMMEQAVLNGELPQTEVSEGYTSFWRTDNFESVRITCRPIILS